MENYFHYKLISLFKEGAMRTPKNKAKLKNYLLEDNITSESSDCIRVTDGGALLWSGSWSKNENFRRIFQKYIDKCLMEKFDVVVFDGYISSTKDLTRNSRSVRISQTVQIDGSYMYTTDRNEFLSNYTNKENFVTALAAKLEANNIKVVFCPSDADTTIVKVALCENRPVTIFTDDTDILCLLLHHLYILRDHGDIYLKNTNRKNDKEFRSCYHKYH